MSTNPFSNMSGHNWSSLGNTQPKTKGKFWNAIGKASPLLGLGGSIISSLIGNIGAKKREEEARKHNIELWNMQNQYNTPKEQMQRLKDAGLNPNLIYGSSPSGASGAAGAISPGKAAPYQFTDPTQSSVSTGLLPYQAQNIMAQTTKTLEDAGVSSINKNILGKSANSLIELNQRRLEIANEELLQQAIASKVSNKTQQQQIEQAVQNLALTKNKVSQSKWEANISKVRSNFADKGINLSDKLCIRLVGLALNAAGIDTSGIKFDLTP